MERINQEEKYRNANQSDTSDSEYTSAEHRLHLQPEIIDPLNEQLVQTSRSHDSLVLNTQISSHDHLNRSKYTVLQSIRDDQKTLSSVTSRTKPFPHLETPSRIENHQCSGLSRSRNYLTLDNTFRYDIPFYSSNNCLDSHKQRRGFQTRPLHRNQMFQQTFLGNASRGVQEEQFVRGICFDMRKVNKIGYGEVRRFQSSASALTKETVANILQLPTRDVEIVENRAAPIGEAVRNIIIISQNAGIGREFVIVESLINIDKEYPELLCVRIPPEGQTVTQIANGIAREMSVRMVVICENCQVLSNETLITNEQGVCRRFEAVRNAKLSLNLIHRPSQKVESRFEIEAETGNDIGQLRQACIQTIGEHIAFREDQILHFSFHGRILKDTRCIGTLAWRRREVTLEIFIASPRAIGTTLQFEESTGKGPFTPRKRTIAIEPSFSTAYLRQEISKQMGTNPKAVKITLNGRRVEEMGCLEEIGDDLVNGCILVAGFKKKKTIRVKESSTKREESFSLFMLETVHVLQAMIANAFDREPFQISLKYKGIPMKSSELLVSYPIKNRTEVTMEIFTNRINVLVYIAFRKQRTVLTIDNVTRSTVDDLIRFSALTYQFDRRCARLRYCDRCLTRFSTLAAEKIRNGDSLVLVYFDQPAKLEGGLITVYTVRPDGQINPRVGAVSGGILLHASKKVKPGSSRNPVNTEDRVPSGIFVCDERKEDDREVLLSKKGIEIKETTVRKHLTESERHALRKRFVLKAKQAKINVLRTHQKTMIDQSECSTYTEGLHQQSSQESDSETEIKTCSCPVDNARSSPEDDGTSLELNTGYKDLGDSVYCTTPYDKRGSLSTLTDPNNTQVKEVDDNVNPMIRIAEEQAKDRGTPVFGDTSGSASDAIYTGGRQVEFFLDTESSDHDHRYPLVRTDWDHTTGRSLMRNHVILRKIHRRRTRTEGDIVQFYQQEMPRIDTFPTSIQTRDVNRWLNTSGITIDIMIKVSSKVGRKWKRLARKLGISEEDIENIEDGKGDLHDTVFNVLLHWKKENGSQASKQVLLEALRGIDMTAIAEYVEENCESLYQTV